MLAMWIGTQADEAFPDAWHSDAATPIDSSAAASTLIRSKVFKTKTVQARSLNPLWNEDLIFVAAEPFEDHLVLTVEDRVGPGKDEIFGRVIIPLNMVEKRADDRIIHSRWFNLEKPVAIDVDQLKKEKFSSRLHLRVCLDGGYHVLDESTHYSSDLRPTAKQLWKPSIGVLELGILIAVGLHPMKTIYYFCSFSTYWPESLLS
ncbi:hypothetical protein AgCh_033705 [Apium graveolens]